ncbi:MAG: T9SS type A sorting domain-containing protein [Gemmatimonadetes bacterium]|jgi:enediyne biosynthesis protein E4|nr:T9SS type A sorting domain-containing protein [Gemmatimonadota bacterium]MBT5141262.1 T9SS type A sorting domain-containing protein [Gemmatimonadota bacterium]MBT5590343.1 T9SS type A sorting domain-containing protein [Gemmatimonadota bacterium]MBT5963876.1 T9SS type A sorting domain-containing protein [Gemmatimonadota bacterium]MBT6626300.1 T9SS type A sorting domain-containing protein [Gemmatimonadota bacterium]
MFSPTPRDRAITSEFWLLFAVMVLLGPDAVIGQIFVPSVAIPPQADLPVIQRSSAFGDLDNDGDLDLFAPIDGAATIADPLPVLRRNDGGNYADITLDVGLTVTDAIYTNNAIWFDYDRDGWLDVYVGSYWFCCIAGSPAGKAAHPTIRNRLYRNFQGTFFEDVTDIAGLDIRFDLIGGGTRGEMGAADFNNDGWSDIYLGAGDPGLSYVFLNDREGHFWEASGDFISIGVAPHAFDIGDVDNDGDLDIFQIAGIDTTLAAYLFHNVGEGQIDDVTIAAGLDDLPLSNNTDGGLIDVDNDGDLDVVIWGEDGVRLNDGDSNFDRPTTATSLPMVDGFLAFDDADADGDLDAVLYEHDDSQPVVYLNSTIGPGAREANAHWLQFDLTAVGDEGSGSVIGSDITVTTGGQTQRRVIRGARSVPQPNRGRHFGLGSWDSTDRIQISWPGGGSTILDGIRANQILEVSESSGRTDPTEPSVTPDQAQLSSPFPNPFADRVSLKIQLAVQMDARVEVFDVLGQNIITLLDARLLAGSHTLSWDGQRAGGARVADGVYLVRMEAGRRKFSQKILLLKR